MKCPPAIASSIDRTAGSGSSSIRIAALAARRRRATLAGQRHDRLADVMALARGQQLLVVEDRAEVVVAGHVGRGEHGRDPRRPSRRSATSIATIRAWASGLPTNSTSSSLRDGRDVVEVRPPGR